MVNITRTAIPVGWSERRSVTQSKKRALFNLSIWGTAAIAFIIVFFAAGGAATYVEDRSRILLGAVLIGAGYLASLTMLFLTRSRPGVKLLATDERDEQITTQAGSRALVALLVYIFVICIALYEVYHDRGAVPVAWMWFVAYSSSFFGLISHSIATLVLGSRLSGRG